MDTLRDQLASAAEKVDGYIQTVARLRESREKTRRVLGAKEGERTHEAAERLRKTVTLSHAYEFVSGRAKRLGFGEYLVDHALGTLCQIARLVGVPEPKIATDLADAVRSLKSVTEDASKPDDAAARTLKSLQGQAELVGYTSVSAALKALEAVKRNLRMA